MTNALRWLARWTLGGVFAYAAVNKLADPAAFEDLDIEAVAARGYQFVRLNQLALEHALGAR